MAGLLLLLFQPYHWAVPRQSPELQNFARQPYPELELQPLTYSIPLQTDELRLALAHYARRSLLEAPGWRVAARMRERSPWRRPCAQRQACAFPEKRQYPKRCLLERSTSQ